MVVLAFPTGVGGAAACRNVSGSLQFQSRLSRVSPGQLPWDPSSRPFNLCYCKDWKLRHLPEHPYDIVMGYVCRIHSTTCGRLCRTHASCVQPCLTPRWVILRVLLEGMPHLLSRKNPLRASRHLHRRHTAPVAFDFLDQGPEIRTGMLKDGKPVQLTSGQVSGLYIAQWVRLGAQSSDRLEILSFILPHRRAESKHWLMGVTACRR